MQEYLAAAYPSSGTPLTPPDPYAAARVKLFTRYFMVSTGWLSTCRGKRLAVGGCLLASLFL